jgi:hypothetical protein
MVVVDVFYPEDPISCRVRLTNKGGSSYTFDFQPDSFPELQIEVPRVTISKEAKEQIMRWLKCESITALTQFDLFFLQQKLDEMSE